MDTGKDLFGNDTEVLKLVAGTMVLGPFVLLTAPIWGTAYLLWQTRTKKGRRWLRGGKWVWNFNESQQSWEKIMLDTYEQQKWWQSSNLQKAKEFRQIASRGTLTSVSI